MIKKLRRKFVCIVMAIALLMLGLVLGIVIYFTGQNMQTQSISMMRAIAARPFQQSNLDRPSDDTVRLPFFVVQINNRGEMTAVSGGYFDLSDREYLLQIATLALSGEESGELKEYDLRYLKSTYPRSVTIVFADTATEKATMRSLTYSSIFIFLMATGIFLVLSILLSRWAVKPVEKAWKQQRQFVADASHELKTPLAVIMANAELLQNEPTVENNMKFTPNILSTSYQMRSLVENMLEMARVDDGKEKLQFTPLELSQLVSDAVLSFQLLYEEKNMLLHSNVSEGISVSGSEQHLYQVMDVLLDNALKYSAPNATVTVELTGNGRHCLLKVTSPGEQLSKEDLKNIFKRFYRADKARTMNGSYGLGLSIAESIVQAHKGKIWAESRDGQNSFHIQLPIKNESSPGRKGGGS